MITGEFKSWKSQGLIFSNPLLNRTFTWVEKNIDKLNICDYDFLLESALQKYGHDLEKNKQGLV